MGAYWSVLVRTSLYWSVLVHTGLYWSVLAQGEVIDRIERNIQDSGARLRKGQQHLGAARRSQQGARKVPRCEAPPPGAWAPALPGDLGPAPPRGPGSCLNAWAPPPPEPWPHPSLSAWAPPLRSLGHTPSGALAMPQCPSPRPWMPGPRPSLAAWIPLPCLGPSPPWLPGPRPDSWAPPQCPSPCPLVPRPHPLGSLGPAPP